MDISDDRKVELFDDLIDWIYDHTDSGTDDDFVRALDDCGMMVDEISIATNISVKEIEDMLDI